MEEASKGLMDITTLLDTNTKLSTVARNERKENFNRYIYGSLNLMMRRHGVDNDERIQLNIEYPLSEDTKQILKIVPGSLIHLSEDENMLTGSDVEGDADGEVVGPMALVPLTPDEDEVETSAGAHSNDGQSEYDPEGLD